MKHTFKEARLLAFQGVPENSTAPEKQKNNAEVSEEKKRFLALKTSVENIAAMEHLINDLEDRDGNREKMKQYLQNAKNALKTCSNDPTEEQMGKILKIIDPNNTNKDLLKTWQQTLEQWREDAITVQAGTTMDSEGMIHHMIRIPKGIQLVQWDIDRTKGGFLSAESFMVDAKGKRWSNAVQNSDGSQTWVIRLKPGSGFYVIGMDSATRQLIRRDIVVPPLAQATKERSGVVLPSPQAVSSETPKSKDIRKPQPVQIPSINEAMPNGPNAFAPEVSTNAEVNTKKVKRPKNTEETPPRVPAPEPEKEEKKEEMTREEMVKRDQDEMDKSVSTEPPNEKELADVLSMINVKGVIIDSGTEGNFNYLVGNESKNVTGMKITLPQDMLPKTNAYLSKNKFCDENSEVQLRIFRGEKGQIRIADIVTFKGNAEVSLVHSPDSPLSTRLNEFIKNVVDTREVHKNNFRNPKQIEALIKETIRKLEDISAAE